MNRRKKIELNKQNKCCTFVLPMCGINYKNLPRNFHNSYLDGYYQIVLCFDKNDENNDMIFEAFLDRIKENGNYIQYQEDLDEILIFMQIPEEYHYDYDLFKKGKYSCFSETYKNVLSNYFGKNVIKDSYKVTVYNTIYPQDYKRLQIAQRLYDNKEIKDNLHLITEVYDKPDLKQETFKPLQQLLETTTEQYELKQ